MSHSTAQKILRDTFGYSSFRGEQQAIVEHVAAGGDALVLMPTGGGKSLCYQIPALLRSGVGIAPAPCRCLLFAWLVASSARVGGGGRELPAKGGLSGTRSCPGARPSGFERAVAWRCEGGGIVPATRAHGRGKASKAKTCNNQPMTSPLSTIAGTTSAFGAMPQAAAAPNCRK